MTRLHTKRYAVETIEQSVHRARISHNVDRENVKRLRHVSGFRLYTMPQTVVIVAL